MGKKLKASLKRGGFGSKNNRWDRLNTQHDDSGQIFAEVSCQGGSMVADWKWKTIGSTLKLDSARSRSSGCSSLYEMAIRSCLVNSSSITLEVLEEIPETIGLALWNRIVAAQLDSFQLFIAFAQRYSSVIKRKVLAITKPNLPLVSYFRDVNSPNYTWLTHLTLSNMTVPRIALIQVSSIANLAVLAVGPGVLAPDVGVDDSLIRTWSRSASEGGFRCLRVLALREQIYAGYRAFEYLSFFPALAIFAATSMRGHSSQDKQMASLGWTYRNDENDDEWQAERRCVGHSGLDELLQAMFRLAGTVDSQLSLSDDKQTLDLSPVIHLSLADNSRGSKTARSGELAMHIWARTLKIDGQRFENDNKLKLPDWSSSNSSPGTNSLLMSSKTDSTRKRAHDQIEDQVARKAAKPSVRTSKTHNIGDLFSQFM